MQAWHQLLEAIGGQPDPSLAFDLLADEALARTASRNVMVALLSDEQGLLHLRHGAGPEWEQTQVETIDVSTRSGIVSYVAATGQVFTSDDVANEPQYRNLFETTASEMAVPILDRHKRVRGVFNVESDRKNAYTEADLEALKTIAALGAVIVNREDAKVREQALVEIGHALDQAQTETDVVKGVLRIATGVLRFGAFSIFLYDPTTDLYVLRGSVGRLRDRIGELTYRRSEGITGWVAETSQPVLIHEPLRDPRWLGKSIEIPGEEIASFLAIPLVRRGRCIGVLRAMRRFSENKHIDNRFTQEDQGVLEAIAEQMASALEAARSIARLIRSERMAAWGELSAKSSHMIGNRVFALKGDVNELGFLLQQPELARASIEELHQSLSVNVLRVEEILQEFRDFLTATQITPEVLDLNRLVEETAREVFPRRTAVSLSFNLDPKVPPVNIDGRRVRRAISELIENSMNFVTEGEVRITTGVADVEAKKRARVPRTKPFVQVTVEDTGPGVVDDLKETIFQPFHSGRVKGMGLGLSIVKGIVDAHGGGVYEDGQEGKGARFVILLPVAERS